MESESSSQGHRWDPSETLADPTPDLEYEGGRERFSSSHGPASTFSAFGPGPSNLHEGPHSDGEGSGPFPSQEESECR